MNSCTVEELEEALRAIRSTLSKSEKAQLKLKPGTFLHTMTGQGIRAYQIAIALINRELEARIPENALQGIYNKEEFGEALEAVMSAMRRVEKMQPKFNPGTPQHTLAERRIKAFGIAAELINRELQSFS